MPTSIRAFDVSIAAIAAHVSLLIDVALVVWLLRGLFEIAL